MGQELGPIRGAVPFSAEHARVVGDLVAQSRPLGLSLGDRACLGLGVALKAPVYTADKSWKKLKVAARIYVIR
jgi:ribonuclease VapC